MKIQRIIGNLSKISIYNFNQYGIFSRMNIIFFGDAGNVTFKCIYSGEDHLCLFCQKVNIVFFTFIHIYRKYHSFMYLWRKIIFHLEILFFQNIWRKYHIFMYYFWERSPFIFHLKNKIIFSGKRDTIFPDNTRKIIFQCDFFGKTIF